MNLSFFIDDNGHIHMERMRICSLSMDGLKRLLSHSNALTVLLTKKAGIPQLHLVPNEQHNDSIKAAGIVCEQTSSVTLSSSYFIRIGRQKRMGMPVEVPRNALRTHNISKMERGFSLTNLGYALGDSDYLLLRFVPFQGKPWHRFDEETNRYFLSDSCFHVDILTNSAQVAAAVCNDVGHSGTVLETMEDYPDYEPAAPHHVDVYTMTMYECELVCQAINDYIYQSLKPDIQNSAAPMTVSEGIINPDLSIGTVNDMPVGLRYSHLKNNTAVFGINGAGKSVVLSERFIKPLLQANTPVLVFAPIKEDFSEAFPDATIYRAGDKQFPLRVNLLGLPDDGSQARVAARSLSMLVNTGGPDSAVPILLENALHTLYACDQKEVSLPILCKMIKAELANSVYPEETRRGLLQACLTRLRNVYLNPEFNCAESGIDLDRVFQTPLTIIEMNSLENDARRALAVVLLENIIRKARAMGKTDKLRLVIIYDETHCLLGDGSEKDPFRCALEDAVNTLRGNGIGFVIADQRVDLVGSIALDGCANHVFLRGRPTEATSQALSLDMQSTVLKDMPYLRTGDALVHVSGERSVVASRLPIEEVRQDVNGTGSQSPARVLSCPYAACRATCSICDGMIHKLCIKAALQTIGYGQAFPDYLKKIKQIGTCSEKERKTANATAFRALLCACVESAMEKYTAAGLDAADENKIAVLRNCAEHELRRQLNFKAF